MRSLLLFIPLIFLACGYKPSVDYQNKILSNQIKTIVKIDVKNPRETIFLKDALNDAVYTILGKNVCYNNCTSTLIINPSFSSLEVLDYDENGFPVLYRSKVILNVTLKDKNSKIRHYKVSGIYDFRVESQSVINDETKLDAYKNASINALNKLFALITKDGVNL